jgi:hypothetical protein
MPLAAVTEPPAAATQGPHEAAWKVGGNAIASTDATAIVAPSSVTVSATDLRPRFRSHQAPGITRTAATAATIDHRRSGTHAPNTRSPAPVRVHGPAVPIIARRAPATAGHVPTAGRSGSISAVRAGSPSSAATHPGPSTRPRTGTAQDRHTGSPHASHRATAVLAGWCAHRSFALAAPSSAADADGSCLAVSTTVVRTSSSARTSGRVRSSASTSIAYGLGGGGLW